jgi:signal transduction histidine kinase
LRNLPIKKKLGLIIGVLLANVILILGVVFFALNTFSSIRAYVGAESLWAKGQKTAIYSLSKYALSRNEKDYRAYLEALKIPNGDHRARVGLQKSPPDFPEIEQGFIEAGNHPDDVKGMGILFTRFKNLKHITHCLRIWASADDLLIELHGIANNLRADILSKKLTPEKASEYILQIEAIDEKLTPLETEFSYWLGEASRWAKNLLLWVLIVGSLFTGIIGLAIALFISRQISSGIQKISDAASQAAKGDLRARVDITTKDELGIVANAFNHMTESLGKLDQLKNDFIATVSHELRTPLTLIYAPLETLLSNHSNSLPDGTKQILYSMNNNCLRLLQMITGLLDFSKLQSGKVECKREPIHLIELTSSLIADFENILKQKDISIEFLPSFDNIVEIDRYLYERILFNLLSNAVKFTPKGGKITVSLKQIENQIRLSVKDTGIGISKENLPRLFERFKQIEGSSTRRFEGTGLGLSLVKEFAEFLDGTITAKSELNQGSEFILECLAPASTRPALSTTSQVGYLANLFDTTFVEKVKNSKSALPKVLVAEDNIELASYIRTLLEPFCEILIATDGEEALKAVKAWNPELVISDIMMPIKDGVEVCKEIKALNHKDILVILLTALTHREAMIRGWEAGADDYLFKPFHPLELTARVKSLLKTIEERKKRKDEKKNREKLEEFNYLASHDLKEPLRMIKMYSELLKKEQFDSLHISAQDCIQHIVDGTLRMEQLIQSLTAYSMVTSKEMPIYTIDSTKALNLALENLKLLVNENDATVLTEDLPAIDANLTHLSQVFQNLIDNAIKYRKDEKPEIHIEASKKENEWIFQVSDNGIGFEPQYAERIFLIFRRLHDQSKYRGTGMGLSICRSIIQRHGGRMWAQSELGKGSQFFFTVPIRDNDNTSSSVAL